MSHITEQYESCYWLIWVILLTNMSHITSPPQLYVQADLSCSGGFVIRLHRVSGFVIREYTKLRMPQAARVAHYKIMFRRICNPPASSIRICNPKAHKATNATSCKCWRIINPYTQHCRIANPAERRQYKLQELAQYSLPDCKSGRTQKESGRT